MSKKLPKLGPDELIEIYDLAKTEKNHELMLLCTQVALLSEMKKDMSSQLSEISAGYRTISEALADCSLGIEIYPKSSEEGD